MKKERVVQLLIVFIFIFFIDYASKAVAHSVIPPIYTGSSFFPFGGIAVFKNFLGIDFCLNLVTNHGAAWGLFSNFSLPLLILRMGAIGALIFYMLLSKKAEEIQFPLIFIIAGAFGNVIDCFVYGHVIDMFHFIFWGYDFPLFNIADSSIFLGVTWMIGQSIFNKRLHVQTEN